jgi:hypothetical protein
MFDRRVAQVQHASDMGMLIVMGSQQPALQGKRLCIRL